MTTLKRSFYNDLKKFDSSYRGLLDTLSGIDLRGPRHWSPPGLQYPWISKLAASFASASIETNPSDLVLEAVEWNPLSQRLPLLNLDTPTPGTKSLDGDFLRLQDLTYRCLHACHEMLHILTWEPFFSGHFRVSNEQLFESFLLQSEAFCFFLTDIVLTPILRVRFPDGEPVFSRVAASQNTFHPVRAFKGAGIHDHRRILRIYLSAFAGGASLWKLKNPLAKDFALRVSLFYATARKPARRLYQALLEAQILDEFQLRFCTQTGLPALLPENLMRLAKHSTNHFWFSLYGSGLSHLSELPRDEVLRVRIRRALQTRAYYFFQIQYALKEGSILESRCRERENLLAIIRDFLEKLEAAVRWLAQKKSAQESLRVLAQIDRDYRAIMKAKAVRRELWMEKRECMYPTRGFSRLSGRSEHMEQLSQAELLAVAELLGTRISESKWISDPEKRGVLLAKVAAALQSRSHRKRARILASVLREKEILPIWSAKIDEVDPQNNRFRELRFIYR